MQTLKQFIIILDGVSSFLFLQLILEHSEGKLAIRVRPFSAREKDCGEHLCLQIKNGRARIFDAEDPDNRYKQFDCDYPFWSHDQFKVSEDGYFTPKNHIFADQRRIYESLGTDMLEDAWQGYNCCLFAYGQSGAGKTYTLFGSQQNEGIIPRFCRDLFMRIEQSKSQNNDFVVAISMTEIYLERLSDLLSKERPRDSLRIKEHKELGIYVEDLSEVIVRSATELEGTIQLGIRNQQINNTYMGRAATRSHTIVKITLRQTHSWQGERQKIVSVINFADLAGSEKVGKTGANYDRFRQIAMIGKSLACLGHVINALADISQGIRRLHVPYRDSRLTRMQTMMLVHNLFEKFMEILNLQHLPKVLYYQNQTVEYLLEIKVAKVGCE